jgi:hypothetical protein
VSTPSSPTFVAGFNEILLIAGIVSFVGAVLGFALTRSRDFVQPTGGPVEQPEEQGEIVESVA